MLDMWSLIHLVTATVQMKMHSKEFQNFDVKENRKGEFIGTAVTSLGEQINTALVVGLNKMRPTTECDSKDMGPDLFVGHRSCKPSTMRLWWKFLTTRARE